MPRIYAVGSNRKPRQCQSGIIDTGLLCEKCDGGILGPWDKYAQNLLLKEFPKELASFVRIPPFYYVDSFDYSRLKLFFLSVLWRSAITSHEFFGQVDIQGNEEEIRRMLLERNPGSPEDFPVMVVKYEGPLREVMSSPSLLDVNGARIYRFRVPGFGWFQQVNGAAINNELEWFMLRPDKPLLVKSTRYSSTQCFKNLMQLQRDGKIPE